MNYALYFIVLIISSLTVGIFAHEGFHVLTMDDPHRISLSFSPLKAGVCCLQENELANEKGAYLTQGIVMMAWIILGLLAWNSEEK